MTFECCGADRMPFGDAAFDKAYTVNTVYFWEDLDRVMAEIGRVLKVGGMFINTLYTNETLARFSHTQYGYRHFSRERLMHAAEAAGFMVEIVPVMDGAAHCVICRMVGR